MQLCPGSAIELSIERVSLVSNSVTFQAHLLKGPLTASIQWLFRIYEPMTKRAPTDDRPGNGRSHKSHKTSEDSDATSSGHSGDRRRSKRKDDSPDNQDSEPPNEVSSPKARPDGL